MLRRFPASAGLVLLLVLTTACAGKRHPLETFVDHQREKLSEKTIYNQAELDFWAALYEPTAEDLEALRVAWVEHGQAFPESRGFAEVEREVRKSSQRVALVALFMTQYELADLKDKALGWSVSPVPARVSELPENDIVLRTLMPVQNPWARYFLLRYPDNTLNAATEVVVSNRTSRIALSPFRPAASGN